MDEVHHGRRIDTRYGRGKLGIFARLFGGEDTAVDKGANAEDEHEAEDAVTEERERACQVAMSPH